MGGCSTFLRDTMMFDSILIIEAEKTFLYPSRLYSWDDIILGVNVKNRNFLAVDKNTW